MPVMLSDISRERSAHETVKHLMKENYRMRWLENPEALKSASDREIFDAFEYMWAVGGDVGPLLAELEARAITV